MTLLRRKKERVRLIDDGALAISRDRSQRLDKKPEARLRSEKHKAWVRSLPCCGKFSPVHEGAIEPMHVRVTTDGCASEKPSDYFILPACKRCHAQQHQIGEWTWHRTMSGYRDPAMVALNLARQSPCDKTREAAREEWERRHG